jgi:hypothetical protein
MVGSEFRWLGRFTWDGFESAVMRTRRACRLVFLEGVAAMVESELCWLVGWLVGSTGSKASRHITLAVHSPRLLSTIVRVKNVSNCVRTLSGRYKLSTFDGFKTDQMPVLIHQHHDLRMITFAFLPLQWQTFGLNHGRIPIVTERWSRGCAIFLQTLQFLIWQFEGLGYVLVLLRCAYTMACT